MVTGFNTDGEKKLSDLLVWLEAGSRDAILAGYVFHGYFVGAEEGADFWKGSTRLGCRPMRFRTFRTSIAACSR